ncbi:MAG: Do family serine endopeptidase [Alphaproteobacteria bacterium]|nr:Do family serine endopeptidase [Alphaproteobacteria bacterium]
MKRTFVSTAALAALALGLVAHDARAALDPAAAPATSTTVLAPQAGFADLVEKVKPAVVNISTTQKVDRDRASPHRDRGAPRLPPGLPEEFRRFFERQATPPADELNALGSGFIIDPAGWVVTNNHVVGEADQITVVLADGTKLPATLKGRDDKTDIALLKVESANPLPYVAFAQSDTARVGDWVIAVGNPFGLGGSVSAGIVSANGRDINSGPYDDFIQIDAPINRGNSGGPTFNQAGEVIGVNTAIFSPNGGSVGIGFAVPASIAREVIAQLREKGAVERGWLGVQIQGVTPEIAKAIGIAEPKGALIAEVLSNGPAAGAGFQTGDVIIAFAGEPIAEAGDLPRRVAKARAGDKVQVQVIRQGKTVDLPVTVARMPAPEKKVSDATPAAPAGDALGMALTALTPDARDGLRLPPGGGGVMVREVDPQGVAAAEGIRAGDVILGIDQETVTSPSDVANKVDEARASKRSGVLVLLHRDGGRRFVALPLA